MWLNRSPSAREQADRRLRDRIVEVHSRSRGTYGAPRVWAELAAEGTYVGRKRVARLMRQARIHGVHRRRSSGGWSNTSVNLATFWDRPKVT